MPRKKFARLSDDELLGEVHDYAEQQAAALEARNARIVAAVNRGIAHRTVGAAAGLTHTAVQYIARKADTA